MSDNMPPIALSVRQPWAWAIIHGGKTIENRERKPNGLTPPARFAVHASSTMTRAEYEQAKDFIDSIGVACPPPDKLVRGAIIGSASMVDVVSVSQSRWFFGPRGLVLREPKPCDPIPCAGELGFFRWARGGEVRQPKPWMTGDKRSRNRKVARLKGGKGNG